MLTVGIDDSAAGLLVTPINLAGRSGHGKGIRAWLRGTRRAVLWATEDDILEHYWSGKLAPLRLGRRDFLWLTLTHYPEKAVKGFRETA